MGTGLSHLVMIERVCVPEIPSGYREVFQYLTPPPPPLVACAIPGSHLSYHVRQSVAYHVRQSVAYRATRITPQWPSPGGGAAVRESRESVSLVIREGSSVSWSVTVREARDV